jgi:hypothetical protein
MAKSEGTREENVGFANDLLSTEINQRNARKDAQESTARWIVLTTVGLMTLLLTLSKEAGIINDETSWLLRLCFIATLISAAATAGFAGGTLWPRKYERLGEGGLDRFNEAPFLDLPTHEVVGQVVATQIAIAKKMDDLHEVKAEWLKRSFIALGATLAFVIAQGVVLGINPPPSHPTGLSTIASKSKWAKTFEHPSCVRPPVGPVARPHIPHCHVIP